MSATEALPAVYAAIREMSRVYNNATTGMAAAVAKKDDEAASYWDGVGTGSHHAIVQLMKIRDEIEGN